MAATNGDATSREPEVSLAEIATLVAEFPGPDLESATKVLERDRLLAKPRGGLGALEPMVEWLATWQGRHPPRMERPAVAVFAGNHGIAAKDVSTRSIEATANRVAGYGAGLGAINAVASGLDADFRVFELALEVPTYDFTEDAAMPAGDCARAMAYGMMAVEQGVDGIVLGQVGVGGDVAAGAVMAALHGGDPSDWVSGSRAEVAAKVIIDGLALHKTEITNPFDALRRLGGYEIAAMVGAIVAARMGRVPVVLDGFVAGAAAAVVAAQAPGGADHCMLGHMENTDADRAMAKALGKTPALELGLNIGEGVGAALSVHLLRAAAALHADMGTRAERNALKG
ncbi:MAG: nicotinate-nucleotide--dimethylbenzimidazole phosphoribosyltransferase [Alphaproteobacteria bacterium]